MPRKPALWKQLGFTVEKSAKGNKIGYRDKAGNYISERKYREEYTHTPMKGSKGYTERQAAKAQGINFRPRTEKQIYEEMKKAAKTPGMTLAHYTSGKAVEISQADKRITDKRNAFVDAQRLEAIQFKKLSGAMTPKQAKAAESALKRQIKHRDKALAMRELMHKDMSREARIKLEKAYREETEAIRKLQNQLEKKGIVRLDDLPAKDSLRYGFYHP